ncbi:MAG: DUF4144 domain-containing protein, partial [Gammaproteobacteria bacterium]|nr:DUF4144 domain-containing protein [Gammaproteobacteria bacterium]
GHDEAELITDLDQLNFILQQPKHLLPEADRLIDSRGQVFVLTTNYQLQKTPQPLELAAVIRLVQQHFFAQAQSCIVKIQPRDIRSALLLLADD